MKHNAIPSECTSIIVGSKMMADGSRVISRSMDWDALHTINFEKYEDTHFGPTSFTAKDSGFHCDLPAEQLGYNATPGYLFPGEWEAPASTVWASE
jgi:dipeptidase